MPPSRSRSRGNITPWFEWWTASPDGRETSSNFWGAGGCCFCFCFFEFFFFPFTGSLSVEESDGTPEGGGRKENFDFFAGYVFSKVLFLAGVLASDFWPLETLALFSTACTVCFIPFVSFLPQNVGQVQHEAARHAEFVKCPSH